MLKFREHLDKISKERNCGILTPPTTDREAVEFLLDYLLGEDWYVVDPLSHEQVNTQMIHAILLRYSRRYRKEVKELRRRSR